MASMVNVNTLSGAALEDDRLYGTLAPTPTMTLIEVVLKYPIGCSIFTFKDSPEARVIEYDTEYYPGKIMLVAQCGPHTYLIDAASAGAPCQK